LPAKQSNLVDKELLRKLRLFGELTNLSNKQIGFIFSKDVSNLLLKNKESIPISIFDNRKLSILEAIVKYLKEELNLKFSQIAAILKRSQKTIWTTYQKAKKKMPESLPSRQSEFFIPVTILQNRIFTTLESIVKYLKEHENLTYHQIAVLLSRDDRTIWTVYKRTTLK
jgi:predicted DNA-binding protein (UPF0251 family)